MQALEFRMKTEGGFVTCHFNTLLDNNLGLDLPEDGYVSRFERHGDMMRFPKEIDSFRDQQGFEGYRELPEDKEFRMNIRQNNWHYYNMNLRLASYDYSPDPSGKFAPAKAGTWSTSLFFEGYTGKYLKGLDYISISLGCGELTHNELLKKDASLWIKKKGGDDYTQTTLDKPEQFLKFHIPLAFGQKTAAAMKPVGNYNYNSLLNDQP